MTLRQLFACACVAAALAALGGCGVRGTPILEPGQVFIPDVGPPVPSTPPLVQSPLFEPAPSSTAVAAGPAESTTGSATTAVPGLQPAPRTETVASSTGSSGTAPSAAEAAATENPDTPEPPATANGRSAANGKSTEFPATEPTEDQQMLGLLADLQRYGTLPAEELKKEIATATATLARQRSDVNRVRLAVLYTMLRTSPQDDQRALQLLDTVGRTPSASPGVRSLAAVLQAQVIERQRAVKTEQQKGDAAVQKLEALRAMEQSLFRDRVRGGGAGGGAGAGGSGR